MQQIKITDELIIKTLQEVIDLFLIPKFMELGMNASGSWISALSAGVENGRGVIKGKDYTYFLAFGRGKNDDQSPEAINHFSRWFGHYVIKQWAIDKGINIDNPYMVARKIALEGTKDRPSKEQVLTVLKSQEVTDYIYEKMRVDLKNSVTLQIKRMLKNGTV